MSRAVSSVIGVVLLVALAVVLSATVLAGASVSMPESSPTASLDIAVDASADSIELSHRGGDPLDVADLDVQVRIDGEDLRHQPPVPFFAAHGFESGPEGAFNSASENTLRAGETTSFRLAKTNEPQLDAGVAVTVQITAGNSVIYDGTTTAT